MIVIVRPHPIRRKILHIGQAVERVVGQPVIAHGPVIVLYVGVLLRLSGLDKFVMPRCLARADVLGAVIAPYRSWLAAPFDDLIQGSNHARR